MASISQTTVIGSTYVYSPEDILSDPSHTLLEINYTAAWYPGRVTGQTPKGTNLFSESFGHDVILNVLLLMLAL